jgi:hypothetical protein
MIFSMLNLFNKREFNFKVQRLTSKEKVRLRKKHQSDDQQGYVRISSLQDTTFPVDASISRESTRKMTVM